MDNYDDREYLFSTYYLAGSKGNLLHRCIAYIISFTALNNLRVTITTNLKMKNWTFRKTNLLNSIQQFSGGAGS